MTTYVGEGQLTFFISTGNKRNRGTEMIQHDGILCGNGLTQSQRSARHSVTFPLHHERNITSHFSAAQANTGRHIGGV